MNHARLLHIVHTEASLGWGGQEIRILSEAAGMLARGHRVTLLCPPHARIHREAIARNIPTVALPIGRKNLKGALSMHGWLKNNPADIINTHSSTDSWLAALASLFLKNPPPLVRTRHISAVVPNNFASRWLYRTATRHVVTTGERLRNQLIKNIGLDPEHVTSVPTGIDTSHFLPGDKSTARATVGLPPGAPVVGIVATLRSWKGHRYLMDAFAHLGDKSALLLIVGDGPGRDNLRRQAEELNISGRVIMPGNQHDVLPWLQSMDVFALPSYANEGVPQAILQAMSCGLPVVTTSVGSIPEIAHHEETAIIVPSEQTAPLQAALEHLLADPALRARLGAAARKQVVETFGREAMLDKMEAIFWNTHTR